MLTVTHQGDAASVHFGPTIRGTDILVVFYSCIVLDFINND